MHQQGYPYAGSTWPLISGAYHIALVSGGSAITQRSKSRYASNEALHSFILFYYSLSFLPFSLCVIPSFGMEGLSSTYASFAVVSLAIQLAETIHRLVEFLNAAEDAPDNVAGIFNALRILSKALTQGHELAQRHSFSDTFDGALTNSSSKIPKLHSKVEKTISNLNSSKVHRRKRAAWKIVLNKTEIKSLQKSILDAESTIL